MTIAATYTYLAPDIADILDECFERAGMQPQAIGTEHIASAMRSIKLMLNSEWHTVGIREWMVEQTLQTVTAGDASYDLPTGSVFVTGMMLRRNSADTPMNPISRNDYLQIANKAQTGRPDRFFADRRYDKVTITLWATPENSTDVLVINYFRQASNPGTLANTLQLPPHTLEAFHAGLSARLAQKYNAERFDKLQVLYRGSDPNKIGGALKAALEEDRERVDTAFTLYKRPRGR
jgi:hypothetical protein